jgi:hypothetical protein
VRRGWGIVALLAVLVASRTASAQAQAPVLPVAEPPSDLVLVHIVSPSPVEVEMDTGVDEWRKVCSSPCDRGLRAGAHYRVSGADVPESPFFVLQPAPRATLTVDPSTKQSQVGGVIVTIVGATGLLPGLGVTSIVASFTIFGAILVCPIATAFNVDYGKCVGGAASLAVPFYASPYVYIPAAAGAGVMAIGITWLASTSGGHPTNVGQTAAVHPVALPPMALGPWTPRSSELALPVATDVPVVSVRF